MPDFGARRDMAAVVAFNDPLAMFEFGFNAPQQSIANETADVTLEVSWDGVNIHAIMPPSGPASAISWEDHARDRVFIRRQGAGGANKFVSVLAATR